MAVSRMRNAFGIIGTVSIIVDMAMGQISRSMERISSLLYTAYPYFH